MSSDAEPTDRPDATSEKSSRRGGRRPRESPSFLDRTLPLVLRWGCQLLATVLLALVLAAGQLPVFDQPQAERIRHLFADDSVLRRTAIASAIGLIVTARVFFRTDRSGSSQA